MYKNCPVKKCNIERGYSTCAECAEYEDLRKCKNLNNWISKIFGFIFRTNKLRNLERIRKIGLEKFKEEVRKGQG